MASPGKKAYLLRTDHELFDALQRWADDEFRSVNQQIEYLLREALKKAGRKPAAPRASSRSSSPSVSTPKTPDGNPAASSDQGK